MGMGKLARGINGEYKKTYKPLIAWLIGYSLISIIIIRAIDRLSSLTKKMSVKTSALFYLIFTVISLYILMLIIYKGEYIYWINGGPNFKQAQRMTSGERKEYAGKHLAIFSKVMLVTFLYGFISLILVLPFWLDVILITLFVVIAGFSTMWIRFD